MYTYTCAPNSTTLNFDLSLVLFSYRMLRVRVVSSAAAVSRVWHLVLATASRGLILSRMTSPAHKKHCEAKTIGTHDGTFHCDEALACYMLRQLPEYSEARIMRSRKTEVLASCDIVVDVGGVYDPAIHRYDHHQRSFTGTMHSLTEGKKRWVTKLSSAGLVYLHFGHRVLSTIAGLEAESAALEDLYDYVYSNFMEEIDAVDNGISPRDGEPRYRVNSTISKRLGNLNPSWNDNVSNEERDVRFQSAMELVGAELSEHVSYFQKSWLPAKQIVETAISTRHEVDASGEVMRLEPFCPWKEHLFSAEESLSMSPSIKYVLYKEGVGTKWRIQAVPKYPNSFENRLSLPEAWCGVRGAELDTVAGIPGCVFVHANGFIGGNETYEGVLKMATTSLEQLSRKEA